jgi:hypothetical protein
MISSTGQRNFLLKACVVLLFAMGMAAVFISWRWPMIGDEGIIHYVVFLMEKGRRPYVDIKDLNLPGAYLLDWLVIHGLGASAKGERLYDLGLCLLGCGACVWSVWPNRMRAMAALAAGLMFMLIHLQDGIMEAGQRDFAMAVLAMCAYAVLVHPRGSFQLRLVLFYVIVGLTAIIKPTLLSLVLVPLALPECRRFFREAPLRGTSVSMLGLGLFPLAALLWLFSLSALRAFYLCATTIGALHSQLPRRGLWFLLDHSLSPMKEVFLLWLVLLVVCQKKWTPQHRVLGLCVLCGLLSGILQGKGLSYHRYPFLCFLLLLLFDDFAAACERQGTKRFVGLAGLLVAVLVLAPTSLWRISRFEPHALFEEALTQQLVATGATQQSIQCLDTYSGCHNSLYRLQIPQSTGYLYDCYLTMPQSALRDRYREEFLDALVQSRPQTIVITDQPCFQQHQGYEWVADWNELADYLKREYRVTVDWSTNRTARLWNRPETPAYFRIYSRR